MPASPTENAQSVCAPLKRESETATQITGSRTPCAANAARTTGRRWRTDAFAPQPPTPPPFTTAEDVAGYDALFNSALKCRRGVGWKYSTQIYCAHLLRNVIDLSDAIRTGTYREGVPRVVNITYPKKRTARSIPFRDRTFQRSINDTVLYPSMVRSFIYPNFACQRGKGTDAAREYWRNALHAAYLSYGTADFYIVCGDFKGYYDNMRHDVTNAMFASRLDPWTAYWVTRTLNRQYKGDKGYNPGSQMVQIAGISYLDRFDHFMKERLHVRRYLRYMDDFRAICRTEAEGRAILAAAAEEAANVGLALHPKKSRVVKAGDGALFLGFIYRVTSTGRVLMLRDPARVKETRRKYRRLARKIQRGEAAPDRLDASYQGVRACMEKGTNRRLVRRMDDFVNTIKKEIANA